MTMVYKVSWRDVKKAICAKEKNYFSLISLDSTVHGDKKKWIKESMVTLHG